MPLRPKHLFAVQHHCKPQIRFSFPYPSEVLGQSSVPGVSMLQPAQLPYGAPGKSWWSAKQVGVRRLMLKIRKERVVSPPDTALPSIYLCWVREPLLRQSCEPHHWAEPKQHMWHPMAWGPAVHKTPCIHTSRWHLLRAPTAPGCIWSAHPGASITLWRFSFSDALPEISWRHQLSFLPPSPLTEGKNRQNEHPKGLSRVWEDRAVSPSSWHINIVWERRQQVCASAWVRSGTARAAKCSFVSKK